MVDVRCWPGRLKKPGRPRAIPAKLEYLVAELYHRGYGYRAIAGILRQDYGLNPHYSSVRKTLIRLGEVRRGSHGMKTYLEPGDVELMEKCAGSARDKLLIRLLFHLGCRVSEVLAIKISDVDFERTTITILHLKTRSMLSCPHCKARLARRHRFCPACGAETSSFY